MEGSNESQNKFLRNEEIKIEVGEIENEFFDIKVEIQDSNEEFEANEKIDREELKCTYCPKDFVSKAQLTKHLKIVHQVIRNHKCMKCDKTFLRQKHLKEHILRLHETKKGFFMSRMQINFQNKRRFENAFQCSP